MFFSITHFKFFSLTANDPSQLCLLFHQPVLINWILTLFYVDGFVISTRTSSISTTIHQNVLDHKDNRTDGHGFHDSTPQKTTD
jgi:hypothetical protein